SAHSASGALTIWADDVTLQGSGAPNLDFSASTAGDHAVVVSGSRATFGGFRLTNTGGISGAVVLVSGANALISGNSIAVGNLAASGILVQASGASIA